MSDRKEFISGEQDEQPASPDAANYLFPVFLKLEQLSLLIVGGGYVGNEKLTAVLQNSPKTTIKLVATSISEEIKEVAKSYPNITLIEKPYQANDIDGNDIVIAALNDAVVSEQVSIDAKQKGKLVNVADKPALCDFYLSSVVQKGNLKIAISTNGKSPTIAKRLKEFLNETLPAELDNLLDNMQNIRNKISGDFTEKVKQLNEITKKLVEDK
jgi:siroheme synthase-like protein